MSRPLALQRAGQPDPGWKYLILDGYIDEPSALGVPPYISPHVRSLAGGLVSGGAEHEEIGYLTVDQWRGMRGSARRIGTLRKIDGTFIVTGCIVPGRYLRGMPISRREVREVALEAAGRAVMVVGPSAPVHSGDDEVKTCLGDPGVLGESFSSTGTLRDRDRTMEEWNEHLLRGAFMIWMHPDHPSPLIAEIETSRGCPRYLSGGCSFCSEPGKGPVQFREPQDIIEEVGELSDNGLENLRIGGQSDLLSYMSPEAGRSDVPSPDPCALEEMMSGVGRKLNEGKGVQRAIGRGRRPGIDTGIIHTDNANPAVVSRHPDLSRKALEVLVRFTTPGTVLALGLESSDPLVRKVNNLNSGPDETLAAVRMMNEVGGRTGVNGLPHLLPGINFLGGLPEQTPSSFAKDLELLRSVMNEKLLVRRINIRGALFPGDDGVPIARYLTGKLRVAFLDFKEKVRRGFDPQFLRNMIGIGGVLKGIYTETVAGHTTFGRQIGSYPLLVGIEHRVDLGTFVDVAVTEFSGRSVTGFMTPFRINQMSFRDLQALPGVGKKRAATIFRALPLDRDGLKEHLETERWVLEHIDPVLPP
ncbi:MAG: radical SAM protein [Candidatus Thermoplasmatota archaeon]|nr:radical SAM protein [Candidatus Thermoplasmatota archaeon]